MACSPLGNFLFERVGYHKNINETISKLNIEVPYSIQNILGSHNVCLQREMMIAFLILFSDLHYNAIMSFWQSYTANSK